jgi:hypothetical protein
MADDTTTRPAQLRRILAAEPSDILMRIPGMGRLMITASTAGVTHELIGPLDDAAESQGLWSATVGAGTCSIDLGTIARIEIDRSGRMKDKVFPRLSLVDHTGLPICGIIGMEGLEPFDAAFSSMAETEVPESLATEQTPSDDLRPPLLVTAWNALEAAHASAAAVSIVFRRTTSHQVWTGPVRELRPAMGFLNIIEPDFHLHLKDGAVAGWRRAHRDEAGDLARDSAMQVFIGLDRHGKDLPLSLIGDGAAFTGAKPALLSQTPGDAAAVT